MGGDLRLGAEAAERTTDAVRSFLAIAERAGAHEVVAIATSAVREAVNGEEFTAAVSGASGVPIRIVTGSEEARLAFMGAVHSTAVDSGLMFDIGGGSLEIAEFRDRALVGDWTLPLGALRVSDRFLVSDPPTTTEIVALAEHVHSLLEGAGISHLRDGDRLVGTGGTIRNLAKIDRAGRRSVIERLHGYVLRRTEVAALTDRLARMPRAIRGDVPGLKRDRVDSVAGGALTLRAAMEHVGAADVIVSGQGLREGLALSHGLTDGRLPTAAHVRQASINAVAKRFATWEPGRAEWRTKLADALVEVLDPGAPQEMREVLAQAATLIDIGRSVDYYDRWDHAAHIVRSADLDGFSHRSITLLAATIERGGSDRVQSMLQRALTGGQRRAVGRAAVVLVLADELEHRTAQGEPLRLARSDHGGVTTLRVALALRWDPGDVVPRFRRAFGSELVVETTRDGEGLGAPGTVAVEFR